jgi:hypothetical protein
MPRRQPEIYAANDADETLRVHWGWPDLASNRLLARSAECHPAGDGARPSRTSHRQTPATDCVARIHIILVYAPVRLVHPDYSRTPPSASQTKLTIAGVFPQPARCLQRTQRPGKGDFG